MTGSNAGIMGTQNGSGSQGEINGRGDQDILGTSTTWWALANTAKTDGKKQNNPRLIESHGNNNLTLYDVDLVNAPFFHVYFEAGNGMTVWGIRIKTPATARNTDGVDPDSSTNVTVNNSYIQDGDDGIAILVQNDTVSGNDSSGNTSGDNNGIRIKTNSSEGGKVSDVSYENICDTGVKHNLEFNPFYSGGTGSGTDVTVTPISGSGSVPSCSFPGYPGL